MIYSSQCNIMIRKMPPQTDTLKNIEPSMDPSSPGLPEGASWVSLGVKNQWYCVAYGGFIDTWKDRQGIKDKRKILNNCHQQPVIPRSSNTPGFYPVSNSLKYLQSSLSKGNSIIPPFWVRQMRQS